MDGVFARMRVPLEAGALCSVLNLSVMHARPSCRHSCARSSLTSTHDSPNGERPTCSGSEIRSPQPSGGPLPRRQCGESKRKGLPLGKYRLIHRLDLAFFEAEEDSAGDSFALAFSL